MSSTSHLPVLIAGAGPTGLVLALTLAQNGIPFRIIEKDPEYHIGQRGAAIQPRTLEAYNLLGVLPDVMEKGIPWNEVWIYKLPGGVEVEKKIQMMPTLEPTPSKPYINPWTLGQARAEAILREHLEKLGNRVELGTELRSFEQSADRVTAQIVKKNEDLEVFETVTCRWLVGADGGKGVVRNQLGLTFLGQSLASEMVIGDIEVPGLNQDGHWHMWSSPQIPMVALRPTEEADLFNFAVVGEVDYAKMMDDDDEIIRIIRKGSDRDDLQFGAVRWKSDYRPTIRMVDKFGDGRVFVAGDAAHVHSPAGAQGMNSGVQDALNLGWKLALVEKGLASPSLLITFTEERLPVIKFMLTETSSLFRQMFSEKSQGTDMENGLQREYHMRQLGVNYRWSSIVLDERVPAKAENAVQEPEDVYGINSDGVPRAGDRALEAPGLVNIKSGESTSLFRIFSTTRHTILIFSLDDTQVGLALEALSPYPTSVIRSAIIYPQDAPSTASANSADLVLIDHDSHAYSGYGIEKNVSMVVIVRPDGVIGAVAREGEGVKQYFLRIFSAVA
ncbi:monooxygenase [Laetiporus sulphureus 93-53]|uniref:Monooxygenase n=1 Tax=Laetiporus sulphureus 93-53 TaxID=1314785 RepID=A0A165ER47_9APHY|nr:monooxygenase [Laetiporus sulphureus 93-53]KZT07592.1 monooxygenase [Laetiporus sulphureus 93-53]